jgi:hypothetical protein
MIVYHYTKGISYAAIKTSGLVLREGEVGASAATYEATKDLFGTPKALWLTREKEMPFTAFPSYVSSSDPNSRVNFADVVRFSPDRYSEWEHLADGVYRIAFDAEKVGATRYWSSPIRDTLALKGMLRRFEDVAKRYGDDVRQWYYTLEALPLSSALSVERWVAGKWVP